MTEELAAIIAEAQRLEREACAVIAESKADAWQGYIGASASAQQAGRDAGWQIADAIRARSEAKS